MTDDDLFTILTEVQTDTAAMNTYKLNMFKVEYGSNTTPTATVILETPEKETIEKSSTGQGSIEALYETLDSLIAEELELVDYQLNSVGRGKDALAEARVQLIVNGEHVNGRGATQDVLEASAHAFINAVNRYVVNIQSKNNQKIK